MVVDDRKSQSGKEIFRYRELLTDSVVEKPSFDNVAYSNQFIYFTL
jgi:hypothetical protein